MTPSAYFDAVRFIVATTMRVPLESVTTDSSYENVQGWDSLANLALVARIGEDLGVEFSDVEIEQTTSVAAILDLVERKLGRPLEG